MNHRENRPIRILFLCTANACRSQMAEAVARHLGGDHVQARSAGARPAGYIHPLATHAMSRMGISLAGHRSKGWDELADEEFDAVLTLCDHAAGQPCPTWPGQPAHAHWGVPDPVAVAGPDSERQAFALRVARALEGSIKRLLDLDLDDLSREELARQLRAIAPTVAAYPTCGED